MELNPWIVDAFNQSFATVKTANDKKVVGRNLLLLLKNYSSHHGDGDSVKLMESLLEAFNVCTCDVAEDEVVAVSCSHTRVRFEGDDDEDESLSQMLIQGMPPKSTSILEDMKIYSVPTSSGNTDKQEEDYGQIPCDLGFDLKGCVIGTVEGEGGRVLLLENYEREDDIPKDHHETAQEKANSINLEAIDDVISTDS
jgi:hypothetical protein